MKRLYFTEEAELDLTQIIEFTNKQWGVDQARQYLEKIHQILHLLTENPGAGLIREDLSPDLFSFPCQRHMIYFTRSADSITAIRILHASMDPAKQLQPND